MSSPLIYAGICPKCEGGVCRVRLCGVAAKQLHGMVLCDECEAMWTSPDLKAPPTYLDPENPTSARTGESIWDESNRWATVEDVCLLGWLDRLIVESVSTSSQSTSGEMADAHATDSEHRSTGC